MKKIAIVEDIQCCRECPFYSGITGDCMKLDTQVRANHAPPEECPLDDQPSVSVDHISSSGIMMFALRAGALFEAFHEAGDYPDTSEEIVRVGNRIKELEFCIQKELDK